MRARAPGKLVLSGAYAVLEGAPALVAAVDRYAVADDMAPVTFETHEVAEAIARGFMSSHVGFDASALRDADRKLGLGSSAAILVASMAVQSSHGADLGAQLFPGALEAHRAAQGGGSGIDVAAACHGGILRCRLSNGDLDVAAHHLPENLNIDVWACTTAASTRDMLRAVRALAARDADGYAELLGRAGKGAQIAAEASTATALIAAIEQQRRALGELGDRAGVPIVTDEVSVLAEVAMQEGACFAPSGAGGGDVALLFHAGLDDAALAEFHARAVARGLSHVPMEIGAPGVHRT